MKQDFSIWQWLFYVSWAILSLWLILKVTGVIKTPIWLEYGVPIGSFILGVLGLYKNIIENISLLREGFAKVTVKVEHLEKDSEIFKQELKNLTKEFLNFSKRTL